MLTGDLAERQPLLPHSLLHPQILDLIAYATSKGLRVATTSNGTLLNKKSLKKLYDVGLRGVSISIDSLEKQTSGLGGRKPEA